jgi:hypothetical protein
MTSPRNLDPLEELAGRNPVTAEEVAGTLGADERAEILRLAKRRGSAGSNVTMVRPGLRGRHLAAGAALVAAAITLVLAVGDSRERPGGVGLDFANAAIRVAEVNPRILVTAPGWSITHVEPLEPDSGQTQFSDGASELSITWYPARLHDRYLQDRAEVGPQVDTEVLGVTGVTVHYGESDYATILPPDGDVFIEIRGRLGSQNAYYDILNSLETTDVATWLGAMPAEVVRPDEQAKLVDSLLSGVPLPPGFDLQELADQAVLNPDGLRLKVASSVACGWLDAWADADKIDDRAAKAQAVEAMATAESWPVMQERPVLGARSRTILELGEGIADGRLDRTFGGAILSNANGVSYAYGPGYALSLECESMTRRRIEPGQLQEFLRSQRARRRAELRPGSG